MITLGWVYVVAGATFAAFAVLAVTDRTNSNRWGNSAFWSLMATSMWAGDLLGDFANGLLVLALVAIAGFGRLGGGTGGQVDDSTKVQRARAHGNRLFAIALIIPATALAGTFVFKQFPTMVDAKQTTLISLALGVIIALVVGCIWLRARPVVALQQGRRLMDSVGWAGILPQMLASLGA
ncbi:MAG: DUF979 family protein, partial [Sphingorhabdus sp.]